MSVLNKVSKRIVYMDNAATTMLRPEVFAHMEPFFAGEYANPASYCSFAHEALASMSAARARTATALGAAKPDEIYFTGSGTEADNWAVRGVAEANLDKGKHIITTAFEHHAVLETCKYLEKHHGYDITYLRPDGYGIIGAEQVGRAMRGDTVLISVIFANNEIGTMQPIAEIGALARDAGVVFHTDAVQAAAHVPICVESMNIDLLSISAHKFYGPKGVGALYVKKGTRIAPLFYGGSQEGRKRAGSHNVPGIVGLGLALELGVSDMEAEDVRLGELRRRLVSGILDKVPHARLNGCPDRRLPGIVNMSFRFVESEAVLDHFNFHGICASSGSACNTDSHEPSHVLSAIGLSHEDANGTIRFSLGRHNTEEDVDYVLAHLPGIIDKLRHMSPTFADFSNAGFSNREG